MNDDEPDGLPLEYRLWLDEGLSDEQRRAVAMRSPWDKLLLDEECSEPFDLDRRETDPGDWLEDAA